MKLNPITIHRNDKFFANLEWQLYKIFGIRRTIPCGRNKKNRYLCCMLSPNNENSYISEDKHKIICKVCGHTHMLTSDKIIETDISKIFYKGFF